MPLDFAISAVLTLFVVVDPVGLVPTFLAVTEDLPRQARRSVAVRASLIAGGLLLFSIASEMVFGVRLRRESQEAEEAVEEHVRNIAAFPLAIPLLAGPGAIAATVLLAGRAGGNLTQIAILIGVVVLVALACVLAFLFAERIGRYLGLTGNIVLSRLLGVLLAALAVQYVVDGVRAILNG